MSPRPSKAASLERENDALRAELDELRQSAAMFKQLHETRIDAFARVSMDGRIVEFNELFRRMVGYEAGELYGMHYRDLTPERWHAVEAAIIEKQVLAVGQSELYEKEYRRKDGVIFPIELRTFLIRDSAANEPAGMAAVIRDVTRRKRGEQALRESEEKFKSAFLTSVDACYIGTLDDGTILEANPAFEQLFGYSRQESIGRTSRELGLWADYADRLRMRDELLARGVVKELDTRGRRKSGELFACSVSATALYMQGRHCVIGVVRDMSERKRAEQALVESREALAESQEGLLALINSTSDMIWSVDPHTLGLLTFNNAFQDYFRQRGIELRVGMTSEDLLPPQFVERWRGYFARALEEGPFVEQYFTQSGLPVLLLSFSVVRRAGTVSAISIFGKDVTDRIVAEEALRRSERRFRTLIEDAPVAIRLAREGRTLYANQRYLDLYGYSSAVELLGRSILEQWTPECRDAVQARTTAFEAGVGVPTDYEGMALRKDGTTFPAHAAAGSVQLPDGPALIIYTDDITDRKQAEAALRQSEERFRQVAENVSDFIWEVDADGLYTYTNSAVEKILGYTPAEIVGHKHFYDLFPTHDREALKQAAFELLAAKRGFRRFANTNVRKDGRTVRIETSGAPMLDDAGNLLGYRGADSDVTERWRAEQAVRDLSGRLIDAQETERARVARELHDDFSQRLALLAVNLDLLRQSLGPDDTARSAVDSLHAQVEALAKDVRRMSHDLHPARLEQLGLASALRGLCAELGAAHQVAFRCEARNVPRDLPRTIAICLYRVAQEALQNVVKHSGASSALVELTTDGGELRLAICDDGGGFDGAAAERRDSLGLANMRERVRMIAGRLTIDTAPGRGTRIEVQAPFGESDPG
ncbi:MAG: PAS domain S-box protein [Bacteroidales bacterium]